MTRFSCRTVNLSSEILILPGFQEGLSRRGSWFACSVKSGKFLKTIKKGNSYMLRYVVHEPDSPSPLSNGEIFHLVNKISFSFDEYKNNLQRMEMQFCDVRKRGKLYAFIYLLGILTVRWYWWIFLTRGEMSLYNHHNAVNLKKAVRTENILSRIWTRGDDGEWKKALNRTWDYYRTLTGDGLAKYRMIIEWARSQSDGNERYGRIAEAYSDILAKFTGRSLYTEMLPTTFFQRIFFFFNRALPMPLPDNVHEIRNLEAPLGDGGDIPMTSRPVENRIDGNSIELFLLASKKGDPVCVTHREPLQLAGTLARAGNMRKGDRELKVILHVGSEQERKALLRGENRAALQARILNAALDTVRQGETLICYYMKEILPVYFRRVRAMYPFRSRLHSLFPWLFITNGIPVASILAAVWLFIDPYYDGKFMINYNRYFSRILQTLDLSYHNLTIEVKLHRGLGEVNRLIRSDRDGRGFRDSVLTLNRFALPVSLMDRVLFNNLTMETDQLKEASREANSFTTVPAGLLGKEDET